MGSSSHRRRDRERVQLNMNRIEQLVAEQEKSIWHIVHRPRMHARTLSEAELLVETHLGFRDSLLEKKLVERWKDPWRQWYAKQYPTIPGSIRCMATAIKRMYPEHERWHRFQVDMSRALVELEGLVVPDEVQAVLDKGPPEG